MNLSEKIYLLRKKEGLSQEELADRLNVSRQAVYKWESGNSVPEIEKIKMIAKLFNVSFDYLLDDNIDFAESESKKSVAKYRKVYCYGESLYLYQANADNGYPEEEERTKKAWFDDRDYIKERRTAAERALCEIGATEIVFIQKDAATAYFFNEDERVFGFYYAGKVQLVCPIENFVAFQCDGGEPIRADGGVAMGPMGHIGSMMLGITPQSGTMPKPFASAVLAYREGDSIKEFKLDFTSCNHYLEKEIKSPDELHMIWETRINEIIKNLRAVQFKLAAFHDDAVEIRNGQKRVNELDCDFYEEKNKSFAEEYNEYIDGIVKTAEEENGGRMLKNIVIWGLVIGFLIYLCYSMSQI